MLVAEPDLEYRPARKRDRHGLCLIRRAPDPELAAVVHAPAVQGCRNRGVRAAVSSSGLYSDGGAAARHDDLCRSAVPGARDHLAPTIERVRVTATARVR